MGAPIMVLFEVLAIFCWFGSDKDWRPFQLKAIVWLTVFILLSLLPVSFSDAFSKTALFIAGQTMVVILLAHATNSVSKHRVILGLFMTSAVVMSLHAIYQIASEDKVGWTGIDAMVRHDSGDEPVWQARYIGIFQDPNDMGMVLAASLSFVVYFVFTCRNWLLKAAAIGCGGLILQGIYLANSRGTILAVLASLAIYLMIKYNLLKALLPGLVLLPIVVTLLPSRFFISNDESSMERLNAWYEGYVMFKANPLLGVGMGNFIDHHYKTAHNSWVLAYSELGFVGFYFWMSVLFTSLFGVFVVSRVKVSDYPEMLPDMREKILKEVNLAKATFFGFIAVLASAFFLSRTYTFPLYFFAGLSTASVIRATNNIPDFKVRPIQFFVLCLSVVFIVLIALVVMVKGPG